MHTEVDIPPEARMPHGAEAVRRPGPVRQIRLVQSV